MRKINYPVILILLWLSSTSEARNVKLNFIVSGLGGANYFVWTNGTPDYTGWGESYGWEAEARIILKNENIGLGLSYGNIYETAIAKNPYTNWVWTREVIRSPILFKLFLYPLGKINPWIGIGKDFFEIICVIQKIAVETRRNDLEGREILQIFTGGIESKFFSNFLFACEIRYGYNETCNTVRTTNFESWQYFLKVGYKIK